MRTLDDMGGEKMERKNDDLFNSIHCALVGKV